MPLTYCGEYASYILENNIIYRTGGTVPYHMEGRGPRHDPAVRFKTYYFSPMNLGHLPQDIIYFSVTERFSLFLAEHNTIDLFFTTSKSVYDKNGLRLALPFILENETFLKFYNYGDIYILETVEKLFVLNKKFDILNDKFDIIFTLDKIGFFKIITLPYTRDFLIINNNKLLLYKFDNTIFGHYYTMYAEYQLKNPSSPIDAVLSQVTNTDCDLLILYPSTIVIFKLKADPLAMRPCFSIAPATPLEVDLKDFANSHFQQMVSLKNSVIISSQKHLIIRELKENSENITPERWQPLPIDLNADEKILKLCPASQSKYVGILTNQRLFFYGDNSHGQCGIPPYTTFINTVTQSVRFNTHTPTVPPTLRTQATRTLRAKQNPVVKLSQEEIDRWQKTFDSFTNRIQNGNFTAPRYQEQAELANIYDKLASHATLTHHSIMFYLQYFCYLKTRPNLPLTEKGQKNFNELILKDPRWDILKKDHENNYIELSKTPYIKIYKSNIDPQSELPPELLQKIFSYLNFQQLNGAQQVSKGWQAAVSNRIFKHSARPFHPLATSSTNFSEISAVLSRFLPLLSRSTENYNVTQSLLRQLAFQLENGYALPSTYHAILNALKEEDRKKRGEMIEDDYRSVKDCEDELTRLAHLKAQGDGSYSQEHESAVEDLQNHIRLLNNRINVIKSLPELL